MLLLHYYKRKGSKVNSGIWEHLRRWRGEEADVLDMKQTYK